MSLISIARRLSTLSARVKFLVMIGADAVFLPIAMLVSVGLRMGSMELAFDTALVVQIALALLTLPVLGVAGLYRTVVRYIDLRVLAAACIALGLVVLLVFAAALAFNVHVLPRSALLIYWFVAFAYVVTSRFIARALLRRGVKGDAHPRLRIAIYGAGDAGAQLAQAMQFSPEYKAICFLDDREDLQHKTVGGLKVYPSAALTEIVFRHDIGMIVLAIPSASTAQKRRLIQRVESAGLPVKILPSMTDLEDGQAAVSDIREVDVADLLGRDAVPPDPALFSRNITGKVVLVTGAGGSIGSELCRQIISQRPACLVLFDHSEFALYTIDHEMQHANPTKVAVVACLGSVLDDELLLSLMKLHRVQTVYHAAAYKHVPIVEGNMRQGLRNNVFGTLNVSRAAAETGVET